jgi:Flp pilus assembly protein TadD
VVVEETEEEKTVRAQQLWTSGTALGRQGRWVQAERAYRDAVALRPDSVSYQLSLSMALLQLQRDSEAADVLLGAIRLQEAGPSPNHRLLAVDYERLIQILERVNRLDEARTARDRQRLHRMLRDAQPPD